jgi:hypothetical protein
LQSYDFRFWILDFGLANGIEMIQRFLALQSKIQNLKSKIELIQQGNGAWFRPDVIYRPIPALAAGAARA